MIFVVPTEIVIVFFAISIFYLDGFLIILSGYPICSRATSRNYQFETFPNEGKIQYFVGLTRTVLTLEYEDFTFGDSYLSNCISLLAELLEYATNEFISSDSMLDSSKL